MNHETHERHERCWAKFTAVVFVYFVSFVVPVSGGELIHSVKPLPLTPVEERALVTDKLYDLQYEFTPYNTQRPRESKRVGVFGDRKVYLADDPVGQFLVCFIGQDYRSAGAKLVLEVVQDEKVIRSKEVSPVEQPKYALLLNTGELKPGTYRLRAKLVGANQYRTIPDYEFQKSKERRKPVAIPKDGIPLLVHAQTNLPNGTVPITTGIPLPRGATDSIEPFVLLENGKPVPAQFTTRAWWTPQKTQIKWVGLDFQAKYDNGKPREYRVKVRSTDFSRPSTTSEKRIPPEGGATNWVTQTNDHITVDTGKLRFTVNRKRFAGVEDASLHGNRMVQGGGGPYLVDERGERFEAANDENAIVEVEERGPVRVTIRATGWYTSAKTKEKLCLFQTRTSAYASQPFLDVNHRTILTYDTNKRKLADVGFTLKLADGYPVWFGADQKIWPAIQLSSGETPNPQQTTSLHQDRWDHFRLVNGDKVVAEGKHSDGWAAMQTKSVAVVLRNLWQLYPKQLSMGPDTMTLHFWPNQGLTTFSEADELARSNIHKIFYAHQGSLLDLKLPQKYYDAMRKIMPMIERQDDNALQANGQGLAIGNDFRVYFSEDRHPRETPRQAALFQNPPHAIADPAWTSATGVEGRFAPADPKRFPNVEKVLVDGFYGSHVGSVNVGENYGMWIWPDTHNNWDPASKLPEWHRFWMNTHYQGGWVNWLMYLRSGDPRLYRWAMDNTDHIMNVSTVNYDDPKEPIIGHMKGAMYHTKGFLPWGSQTARISKGDDYVEVGAHFINPDTFIIRWLLLGDHAAKELMEEWGGRAINRVQLPPERSREACVTLGELISYYETTWDPQAIIHIHDLASDMMSRPVMEIPATTGHAFFHQQWVRRYWELTRDPRIVAWLKECADQNNGTTGFMHVDALLAEWTGDKNYLTQHLANASTIWQDLYFNEDDPLNGLGLGCVARSWTSQALAYYAGALPDAGIASLPTDESKAEPAAATMEIPKANNFAPHGWFFMKSSGGYGYLHPKGAEPVVQLTISPVLGQFGYGPAMMGSAYPSYVRLEDADGKVLLETTILNGSKRPEGSITLDARKQKAPWKLYKGSGRLCLKWDGAAEALTIAPTADEAFKGKQPAAK